MMATCMQCGGSFNVNQQLAEANAELARLREENERLRKALKPFADRWDGWEKEGGVGVPVEDLDLVVIVLEGGLPALDFYRAAAALKGEPVEEGKPDVQMSV